MNMKKLIFVLILVTMMAISTVSASTEKDLVWVVEPKLEYEYITYYQGFMNGEPIGVYHGNELFANGHILIDKKTGEIIEEGIPDRSTGGLRIPYLYGYDKDKNSFFYNAEYEYRTEETETVMQKSKSIVLSIDEMYDVKGTGKYAIYYNGEFVSDYIYDWIIGGNSIAFVKQNGKYAIADNEGNLLTDFDFDYVSLKAGRFPAVKIGERWGFTDMQGNEVIPFIFEDAVIAGENTAFVKYNGRYGILDIEKTAHALTNVSYSPATGRNSMIYIFSLLFLSASLIILYKLRNKNTSY